MYNKFVMPYRPYVASLTRVETLAILDKVRRDRRLARADRTAAARLTAQADRPALVLERLQQRAYDRLPSFARDTPVCDLVRVVTVSTFLMYHAKPEIREAFTTSIDFALYVADSEKPSERLYECLSDAPILFHWTRSWLADARPLMRLDGRSISAALELEKEPPFVVFFFELPKLLAADVLVRTPNALDSVLGPNPQWRPGGPVSGVAEFVDGDVPRAALTRVEWRA